MVDRPDRYQIEHLSFDQKAREGTSGGRSIQRAKLELCLVRAKGKAVLVLVLVAGFRAIS